MIHIASETAMKQLGQRLGGLFRGGEMIELIGDVGAGKTTFTKGLGQGLRIDEDVQSPSFTLSREYQARDGLELHHYDFYRLSDPGVVAYELAESIAQNQTVTVVEWGGTVHDVLPPERLIIKLYYAEDAGARECDYELPKRYDYLSEAFV